MPLAAQVLPRPRPRPRPGAASAPDAPEAGVALAEADLGALQRAAGDATQLLRALANADRLLLVCALVSGERCVGELARLTGIRQPTLSQQLGVLRADGVVSTRRDGRFVHYRIETPHALEVVALLHRLYCTEAFASATAPSSPASAASSASSIRSSSR